MKIKDPLELQKSFDAKVFSTKPHSVKVLKPWGHEIIYTKADSPTTGKIIYVNKGHSLSTQFHDEKIETICLFSGSATLTLSNSQNNLIKLRMQKLKGYQIERGQIHSIHAEEDAVILETSLPETGNTFRLIDKYSRGTETEEMRSQPNRGWRNHK